MQVLPCVLEPVIDTAEEVRVQFQGHEKCQGSALTLLRVSAQDAFHAGCLLTAHRVYTGEPDPFSLQTWSSYPFVMHF